MDLMVLKKGLVFGVIVLFCSTTMFPIVYGQSDGTSVKSVSDTNPMEYQEKCYGFAVPLLKGENLPLTSIQQGITNTINDCLRMNISVYWAASNFTVLANEAGTNDSKLQCFEQGTFIIPFTGNHSTDTLITTLMFNYGYHNEIEQFYPVDYYHLLEPINISAYHLNLPRMVYYFDDEIVWDWLVFHYDTIQQGGFLNIDFFLHGDNTSNLTTDHYNAFICLRRGVGQGIPPVINSAFDLQKNTAVRTFVQQGGGYIGVKYGATVASSGPSALLGILKSFLKRPFSVTGLSLTNSSYAMNIYSGIMTLKLVNTSSPIAFGLNATIRTLCEGGPIFSWLGQHTYPQAIIQNVSLPYSPYFPSKDSSSYQTFERWRTSVVGRPLWITSQFGKGKVVTYGDDLTLHYPERNDRVFDNALFFVTSDDAQQLHNTESLPFSTIEAIYAAVDTIKLTPGDIVYPPIWTAAHHLQNVSHEINVKEEHMDLLLYRMQEERKWDVKIHMLPTIDPRVLQVRLRDLYYDTFTRFLNGFSQATTTLQEVVSAINATNASNLTKIKEWMTKTLDYFTKIDTNGTQILTFDQWFMEQLQAFTLKYADQHALLLRYNQYDHNIKRCYKYLSQAWLETIQLYRVLWYDYEAATISSALKNHDDNHSFFLSQTQVSPSSPTGLVYVNGSAAPGGDGSVTRPYRMIQDGIEAASPGDTVVVSSGTYHEHPVISKSLILIGENKDTTVIDGEGKPRHVVWITADYVTIRGFTVTNGSKKYCGGIVFYSNNNTIIDNIVSEGYTGIANGPAGLRDNVIVDNIVENNTYCGIGLDSNYLAHNEVSSNVIRNNGYCGLFLVDSNNSIHDNALENNGILIYPPLYLSYHLIIYNNTINGKPLVYIEGEDHLVLPNNAGQIIITACSNCTMKNMDITSTNPAVEILSSRDIQIENSTFADNKIGVWVYNSTGITILKNTFSGNSWSGLWLYTSNKNRIQANIFQNNSDGVLVFRSKSNQFAHNTFMDNTGGLSLWSTSMGNAMTMNDFFSSHIQAYDQGINRWAGNYWDDWVGLQHPLLRFIPYRIPGGIEVDWHPLSTPDNAC
jgi:parallel beta-helix repeat protein